MVDYGYGSSWLLLQWQSGSGIPERTIEFVWSIDWWTYTV